MFYALFDVENTGNQQVKNQEIRFEFTDDSEILDVFFEPQRIAPEIGFEEMNIPNLGKNEKKYKIGTIRPQERVGFRFIVQSSENKVTTLKYYTKNDDDVSFIAREAKKAEDDIDQVKYFLSICLTVLIVLPLLGNILGNILPFSELFISIAGLVISVLIILPRLGSFIESVVNLVSGSLQPDIDAQKVAFIALSGSQVNVDTITMINENKSN